MCNPFKKVINILDIISEYDAVFFDLWGVIFSGTYAFEGVAETINTIIKLKPTCFITNSSRLPIIAEKKLRDAFINVDDDMVFTSGQVIRSVFLNSSRQSNLYYIDEKIDTTLLEGIKNAHITQDIRKADRLIISAVLRQNSDLQIFDTALEIAAQNNIPALCINPDFIAIVDGDVYMCSRYFAKKYERMGGKVAYFGKPETNIFEFAYAKTGPLDKNKILMIGDTLYTDILGAHNFNIKGGLVLTGNTGSLLADIPNAQDKLNKLEKICYNCNIIPDYLIKL